MQKQTETGKLVVKDGWLICPVCGNKRLFRLEAETEFTAGTVKPRFFWTSHEAGALNAGASDCT